MLRMNQRSVAREQGDVWGPCGLPSNFNREFPCANNSKGNGCKSQNQVHYRELLLAPSQLNSAHGSFSKSSPPGLRDGVCSACDGMADEHLLTRQLTAQLPYVCERHRIVCRQTYNQTLARYFLDVLAVGVLSGEIQFWLI